MNMHAPQSRQTGVALIVVLMLLLIVTLLGLASMRNALMQERMAGATYARSVAFNSAEATLRIAEAAAAAKPAIPGSGCSNGVCARPLPGAQPLWEGSGFWDGAIPVEAALGSEYQGVVSKYVIEDYGIAESPECGSPLTLPPPPCSVSVQVYQIVARSVSPGGAEVVLQSLYKVP